MRTNSLNVLVQYATFKKKGYQLSYVVVHRGVTSHWRHSLSLPWSYRKSRGLNIFCPLGIPFQSHSSNLLFHSCVLVIEAKNWYLYDHIIVLEELPTWTSLFGFLSSMGVDGRSCAKIIYCNPHSFPTTQSIPQLNVYNQNGRPRIEAPDEVYEKLTSSFCWAATACFVDCFVCEN